MQIADGRKTVEQVRAGKNETSKIAHAKERAARSSLNSEDNTDDVSKLETQKDAKGVKQSAKKRKKKADAVMAEVSALMDDKPKRSTSQDRRELEAKQAYIDDLEAARERDQGLDEQLQAAKIKIYALEGEVEDLKAENAKLREQLDAAQKVAA